MDHINRFGEIHPQPARGKPPYIPLVEDEYGMAREEDESVDPDWSHDPRSESAHEKHVEEVKAFTPDEKIKEEADLALYLSPDVGADEIELKVEAGVVSMYGRVHNRRQKIAAERCIEKIPMVEDILNYLEIRL